MVEFLTILSFIAVLILFGVVTNKAKINNGYVLLSFALLGGFLICFSAATKEETKRFSLGMPLTEIATGSYKVNFVYKTPTNVSVGVEKKTTRKEDLFSECHLYFYQFPVTAFASEEGMDGSARRLVVTEGGGFRKLELFDH